MLKFISKLFGSSKSEKDVQQIMPIVEKVNHYFSQYQSLSNDELRNKTQEFRQRIQDIFLNLSFENVQAAAQAAMKAFENKEFDAVEVIYSEFRNAATQRYTLEQFLPIPKVTNTSGSKKSDFIFEPVKEELIAELMPKILNTQLYKAVLDCHASEHGARMTAMDKASDNANELLKSLKISYNRARQAAITTELTEIVSGAAALQG